MGSGSDTLSSSTLLSLDVLYNVYNVKISYSYFKLFGVNGGCVTVLYLTHTQHVMISSFVSNT